MRSKRCPCTLTPHCWPSFNTVWFTNSFPLSARSGCPACGRITNSNVKHDGVLAGQKGLFSISRNPIFLATRLALLGFFLVAPNAATLALLAAAEVVIQVQVRLEEKHLLGLHGSAYEQYFSKVPRWL